MALFNTSNYGSVSYSAASTGLNAGNGTMCWEDADTGQFNRDHITFTTEAVEQHTHGSGLGLAVRRLYSGASAPANAGDVQITSTLLKYMDSGGSTVHSVPALDTTNTYAAASVNDFSAQTGANSLKVPVGAGLSPTQNGAIGYDSTANAFYGGVAGVKTPFGPAIPVTVPNGGTGDITLTAHGVLVGEGTSAVAALAAGATGTLLAGNNSADPSMQTISSLSILQNQNSSDNGKKFQSASGHIDVGTMTQIGSTGIYVGHIDVSWPAVFNSTPTAQASGSSGTPLWSGCYDAISTTGITLYAFAPGSGSSGPISVWGIG